MTDQYDENGFIIPKRWQIRAGTLWDSHHLTEVIKALGESCTTEEQDFLVKLLNQYWYDWNEAIYKIFKQHEKMIMWRAYHGTYKGTYARKDAELAKFKEDNKDFVRATRVE